ncbi:MAG TPA: hypothetical protein VFX65_07840 [Candidatus Limnocylindrales bacterium]|nr:hypothetical protein [Candidatus Limnocylindrales bacterium]
MLAVDTAIEGPGGLMPQAGRPAGDVIVDRVGAAVRARDLQLGLARLAHLRAVASARQLVAGRTGELLRTRRRGHVRRGVRGVDRVG